MKKIERQNALTGDWWTFDTITKNDLVFDFSRAAKIGEYANEFTAEVTVRLSDELCGQLDEAVDGKLERVRGVLMYTGLSSYRPVSTKDYTAQIVARYKARLRGVRKDETRRVRLDEAKAIVVERINPKSQWFKDQVATLLVSINEGFSRFAREGHERTLRVLAQNLGGFEGWRKYVDDKHAGFSEEKKAIEAVEAKIKKLEEEADALYVDLQQKRSAAWVDAFEADGWRVDDEDGGYRLPAEVIAEHKRLCGTGEAFKQYAKHRGLFVFYD